MLQRVIQGRITFTPTPSTGLGTPGYDFEAPTRFDKLFTGVAFKRPASLVGDLTGCENINPEDTFDADYGALLERAYSGGKNNVEGVASPTGSAIDYTPKFLGNWRSDRRAA